MKGKYPQCVAIEPDLVAAATDEADALAAQRVAEHVGRCTACRQNFDRYRSIDAVVDRLRTAQAPSAAEARARTRLETRLADLRSRLLTYRIFSSPLGNILIARSEHGVSLVEYLGQATTISGSRLSHLDDIEAVRDGAELKALYQELMEYLEGTRNRLEWPLDLRLARGDFDRMVLQATAGVPYGAVTSYTAIAREVGNPAAARAVAQALRWNPLPLVVPCHRIVGCSGSLTGYAGNKVALKQRILSIEGIPTLAGQRDIHVTRDAMYVRHNADAEYCLPTCGSLPSLTLSELTLFGSRERAEAAGFAPCSACRPDLHPLN